MEALINLSWRVYPAALLMAAGFILSIRGALRFRRGFRRAIVGLAIAGIAAAWLWQIDWILVLSLVIGGEELLESTLHIQALGMAERTARRSGRNTPPPPQLARLPLDTGASGLAAEPVWLGPHDRDGGIVRRY